MPIKKHEKNDHAIHKEQLHTPTQQATASINHHLHPSPNQTHTKKRNFKREAAIIAGAVIMILSVPMGVNFFFLILFTQKEQLMLNISGTIIATGLIALFGLFGARISTKLHKLALVLLFVAMPFGIFHILLRGASIVYKQNIVYSAILAIILFAALIIGFKKNTEKE